MINEWFAHPPPEPGQRSGLILDIDGEPVALLGAPSGGGAAGRRDQGWVPGGGGRPRVAGQGSGLPGDPAPRLCANFSFVLGQAGGGGAVPERLRPGALGVNPKAPQAPRARLHVSQRSWCREETERERKQETRVPGKSCRASGNYKNVTPRVGLPTTTLTCRVHPSASSCPLGSVPPQRRSACARLAVSNQPERLALGAWVGRGGGREEEAETWNRLRGAWKAVSNLRAEENERRKDIADLPCAR